MMVKKSTIPIIDYTSPSGKKYLERLLSLRRQGDETIAAKVSGVIADVRDTGDKALFAFTKQFDNVSLTAKTLRIAPAEIAVQAAKAPDALQRAIYEAAKRIHDYHKRQHGCEYSMLSAEGDLHQIVRPLNRIAVYVPGGHGVYPSSVLMNVIPAKVAGVAEIVAVTPPRSELDPGIAYALKLCKIDEVYRIGGAQAIAALAWGTKSIRPVDKIVGPGNAWVQAAKRFAYGTVDIDSIAGPSEVAIVADGSVDPSWVAFDLLAQAEHGSGDELAVCITDSEKAARNIAAATVVAIDESPVAEIFRKLPPHAITIFLTADRKSSFDIVNILAPEHLEIMTTSAQQDLKLVKNAAAVFLGPFTPVALGDYFIGTNHVLPTGGAARFSSPLGVESFLKRMSVASVSLKGLQKAAPFVSIFARAEGFVHHALSVEKRMEKQK
jgi:histidinol dehydrogenase